MAKNIADLAGARSGSAGRAQGAPIKTNGTHAKAAVKGLRFGRHFTPPGSHAFDLVEWERRTAAITGEKGQVIFEQKDVEVPRPCSQLPLNLGAQNYFPRALRTPPRPPSPRHPI